MCLFGQATGGKQAVPLNVRQPRATVTAFAGPPNRAWVGFDKMRAELLRRRRRIYLRFRRIYLKNPREGAANPAAHD